MKKEKFYQEIADTVPFKQGDALMVDKFVWRIWVREIEAIIKKYKDAITLPIYNILVPLNNGCYLRICSLGGKVESLAFYEKSITYRFNASNDYQVLDTQVHDVIQINGLYPTYLNFVQKPFFHTQVV